jgi:hypothetical protein
MPWPTNGAPMKTPQERWNEIKADPTIGQIDDIDKDVQWSETEPAWWLEMMEVRRRLVAERGEQS